MVERVEIYTDGACKGNPGPGGWGVLCAIGIERRSYMAVKPHTTNNRMELMAVIRALGMLTRPVPVRITTDSQYVRKGITEWIINWKKNGWQTAAKKPVKNSDLWRQLDQLVAANDVVWAWVKGHSGHPDNERADMLANLGIENQKALIKLRYRSNYTYPWAISRCIGLAIVQCDIRL